MSSRAGFSWKQEKLNTIDLKIQRAITMANSATNPDFKALHPDWVRDAQKKDYTLLKTQVKEKCLKYQVKAQQRRDKRSGKD